MCRDIVGSRAQADIYDNSGKLLLAKDHEITPTALKRIKQSKISPEKISSDKAKVIDFKTLPIVDVSELITKMPHLDPALISFATGCLEDSFVKIKLNDLLYMNLLGLARYVDWVYSHSINVAMLSIMIAQKMRLVNLSGIIIGAIFHDTGKLLIPREIINKKTILTAEEFAIVKQHSRLGGDMLSAPGIDYIIPMIAVQHHERLNGQGYPFGLSRGQIHIYAQIVGLADAFDAITSERPYRKARSPEEALDILLAGKDTEFAPNVINACEELLKG